MHDDRLTVQAPGGVPVVTAPQEIDITSTAGLRIFAITGLDRVIPNFASLQEALVQAPAAARPDQPAQKAATGATE